MENEIALIQTFADKLIEFSVNYSMQVLGAVIILIVGVLVGKWAAGIIEKLCLKSNVDITLSKFLASIGKILVIAFALIIAMGKFGVTIAPFIAAIGAAAFGATYAIQGPLSNYGAGLAIILGRPFVVGDTITVAGVGGVVESIKLGNTTLVDEDGIQITIPNKHIIGEILHNSGAYRLVESKVGISYGDDPEKAIRILQETVSSFENVAQEPMPQFGIENFGDSAIELSYRYWVPSQKYFQTFYAVNSAVHKALQKGHITIPFPQREVLIKKEV